ncbi:MAG TPA: isoprenylcysteine carboxylmethyltransferase family protein [Anaerolineaceae bacterium]|nr:isoprenylcysteine carboxylmethyltransferase family protein [Anaerolineaceae bacterium]HPN53149.1 isoprenylcysteine carboxylmethyltransferase family protein [Anaerolineaceae bacterium]
MAGFKTISVGADIEMVIQLFRWLTLVGVLFWMVIYWQGGKKVFQDIRSAMHERASDLDAPLMVIMSAVSLMMVATAVLVALGMGGNEIIPGEIAVILGCLLCFAGVAGTFYCRHVLGQFWTAETSLQRDHRVMDQGPYGMVRHPIYSFAILLYAGLGLVFSTGWCLGMAGIMLLGYLLKAWDENRYLERNLAGYREYQQRVRYRLIPWLW